MLFCIFNTKAGKKKSIIRCRVLACLGQWVKLTQVPGSRPTKKKKKRELINLEIGKF